MTDVTTIIDTETVRVENGQTIIEKGGRTYVVMPDGLRRWTDTRYEREPWESPYEEFYDASWTLVRICRNAGQGRSSRRECGTPEQMHGNVFDALGTLINGRPQRESLTEKQIAENLREAQARRNMSEAVIDKSGNVVPTDRATIVAKHVRMARVMGVGGPAVGIGLGWAIGGKTGAVVGGVLGAIAGVWSYMDHMEQGEIASRPAEPMRVPVGGIPTMADVPVAKQPAVVVAKQPAPVVEKVQPGPVPVATFLSPVVRPRVMLSRVANDAAVAGGSGRESSRADTMLRLME